MWFSSLYTISTIDDSLRHFTRRRGFISSYWIITRVSDRLPDKYNKNIVFERFNFVHLPGTKTQKMVHPAIYSCGTHYINLFKSWKKHLKVGKSMHTTGVQV